LVEIDGQTRSYPLVCITGFPDKCRKHRVIGKFPPSGKLDRYEASEPAKALRVKRSRFVDDTVDFYSFAREAKVDVFTGNKF
jgi:hypothetical protein